MAQPLVLPLGQNILKDQPLHLAPAAPAPQGILNLEAWTHWINELFAALVDLLLPENIENTVIVIPSLASDASYDVFKAFVHNQIDSHIKLAERDIEALTDANPSAFESEMGRMGGVLKILRDAGQWIEKHPAEFRSKGREAVQIKGKLLQCQQVVSKFLAKMPYSEDILKPAPTSWSEKSQEAPGLRNMSGSDCFMNSAIHGVFGDPEARRWIALNRNQSSDIRLAAAQYHQACTQGRQEPLSLAPRLRDTSPNRIVHSSEGQQEVHLAFNFFTYALTGTDLGVGNVDPHFKERQQYEQGNPFVHKITRRATFEDIDMDQVKESEKENFQGNVHIKTAFEWCPLLQLEGAFESRAFESLLDTYLRPQGKNTCQFTFEMKDGSKKSDKPASQEVNTFEKRPDHIFFSFKRSNYKVEGGSRRYYLVSDPIELNETFYLDPKHVDSGEGGEYRVTYFSCHGGSIDPVSGRSGGHYIAYRKIGGQWFYYSDSHKRVASIDEVRQALRTKCELLKAERVDNGMTPAEVTEGAKRNVQAAKEAALQREAAFLNSRLPTGSSLYVQEDHLKRLRIFNSLLNKEPALTPEKLYDAFQKLPPEFQALMQQILISEEKMEEGDGIRDHLLELKTIMKSYLTSDLNDHIVEQYIYIRKKRLQMVKDELQNADKLRAALQYNEQAQAGAYGLTIQKVQAATILATMKTLLDLIEGGSEEERVKAIGEQLFPGLCTLVEAKQGVEEDKPTLQAILTEIRDQQEAFLESLKVQEALYLSTEKKKTEVLSDLFLSDLTGSDLFG